MPRSQTWRSFAAEGMVIVVSILAAFALDAWWDARSLNLAEAETIESLIGDFESYSVVLEGYERGFTDRAAAARLILAEAAPGAGPPDRESEAAIGRIAFVDPIVLRGGILETVLRTDGISVFSSSELRKELSTWLDLTGQVEVMNEFTWDEALRYVDFLRARVPIQSLRESPLPGTSASNFEPDYRGLMSDLEFSNLVHQQYYATALSLTLVRELRRAADQVIQAARTAS